MDLDPAVIIPALLFTAVAIYFASLYLNKKPDASAAAKKKPKVGYGDDIPPSRVLGQPTRSEPAPVKVKVPEPEPETVWEPEPIVEFTPEPEPEIFPTNDVAAADDMVMFTPGKKQSKFETMMTKEEIEEEQRVQQEQLAAIFLLLRENQEALGEVTEGEMEEQLKLYSL
ncbi:hypothetical protein JOQ06_010501 [Pogonophryne albipinna]|uniref:Matrix-remodeling-associated protein 7 helical domain-containing protein n=1 Tax=Pogonophryne albipinna TaxID=1090488 RepID=A0AAD6AU28_9TELE|nr:hypothetical protein JOQ06_010501 [Pogonophryne albipinna]